LRIEDRAPLGVGAGHTEDRSAVEEPVVQALLVLTRCAVRQGTDESRQLLDGQAERVADLEQRREQKDCRRAARDTLERGQQPGACRPSNSKSVSATP